MTSSYDLAHLPEKTHTAAMAAERLLAQCLTQLTSHLTANSDQQDSQQLLTHGVAWLATYTKTLTQLAAYAARLQEEGKLSPLEFLLISQLFAEYIARIAGGIPLSSAETFRVTDLGLSSAAIADFMEAIPTDFTNPSGVHAQRHGLAEALISHHGATVFGDSGQQDTMVMIREQFARFTRERITPHAQKWHCEDLLIPHSLIQDMAALGVFGLTIGQDYGGSGLPKEAMCVVSEELSRGFLSVGSLATRSEIAAELIALGGTEEQKKHWLAQIAAGTCLPTAVFTEPDTGSDLAALKTRAIARGDSYHITGAKTWITHGARSDVMTLLARTDSTHKGYAGLSVLLVPKKRGTVENPFPQQGLAGEEIATLGYRGMKEYTIAFDDFQTSRKNLLGEKEGQGFKQLMQTFETARIQTAARAIGVAQSALDSALRYALDRQQFGKPLYSFARVRNKITFMACEIMAVRQLTYYAARQKDAGHRCDLEAGMAKLLAAQIAWSAADNNVQIHGGNGFALEQPASRILSDARVLSIFEGAAEIQAQIIARRLMEKRN